jgi:hypothetical protein
MIPKGGEDPNNEDRRWMEEMEKRMRMAMYAKPAQFARMTKETDHDFATFGNAPFSCRPNKNVDNLLYRNWHLRDVVWEENEEGGFAIVARKWKPTARDLVSQFKNKSQFKNRVDPKVSKKMEKDPFYRVKCYHIVVEAEMYSDSANGRPFFSIYYDRENRHIMESLPVWINEYRIPRWQTVSGSQYAFSPATITALPEARLIQSMAYTLLEAGEKATNPPMVGVQDAVRSDVSIYAGGITWVDQEYDERLGAALRPVAQDLRGLPFGQEMLDDSRGLIAQAFYLNKLTLPERAPEMTAYEIGQRVQEYIRGALPIFEPMEPEYNGAICDVTFETLFRLGVFGSPHDIPKNLQGTGIEFEYMSPLHDVIEEQKGQKFLETNALLMEAMNIDRGAVFMMDTREALRDAMDGIGVPAEWMNSKDEVEELVDAAAEAEEEQLQLEQMVAGSEVAKNIGQAGQDLEMV